MCRLQRRRFRPNPVVACSGVLGTERHVDSSDLAEGSFIMNDFVMKYLLPSNESSQRKLEDWPSEAIDEWSVSEARGFNGFRV